MIIGLDFAEPFWKYLFNAPLVIEDLKHLMSIDTFNNYMLYLNVEFEVSNIFKKPKS